MLELPSFPVSRLAPTPNGELHWGNLLNFALTWAMVRQRGGKLWLRFDDIDRDRCDPRFAQDTRELLHYLGLDWDEEFSDQPSRIEDYRRFLTPFPQYVCRCSRQEIVQRTGGHYYDGHCRNLKHNFAPQESAIRFRSPMTPARDFILWRREDLPAYHLTCVHDEEKLGINLIVRGEDLLESTTVQKDLSQSLKSDPFKSITVFHHALVVAPDGKKLSKSRSDGDLLRLMRRGTSPKEIWTMFGNQWGVTELRSASDLLTLLPRLQSLCGVL